MCSMVFFPDAPLKIFALILVDASFHGHRKGWLQVQNSVSFRVPEYSLPDKVNKNLFLLAFYQLLKKGYFTTDELLVWNKKNRGDFRISTSNLQRSHCYYLAGAHVVFQWPRYSCLSGGESVQLFLDSMSVLKLVLFVFEAFMLADCARGRSCFLKVWRLPPTRRLSVTPGGQ